MAAPPRPFPESADHDATYPTKFAKEGLTFDDVLLVPGESSVLPATVSTATAQVNLLSQTGQTAGSRLQSQPIFRFDPSTRRFGSNNVDSYYQIQLAARYSF